MTSHGVAFITGASRGIGRAIALRLAGDGFDVAINDLPVSREKLDVLTREILEKGRKAYALFGDVSIEKDVEDMINAVTERMGRLDVMVANAGICTTKPLLETTVTDWDHTFSVNGRGVFLCYKYAGRQMIKQGRGGRIIGASSVAGKQGESMLGAYSSSKFAVRGLTQSAAREFGPYGITVNAYSPGPIHTDMLRSIGESFGGVDQFLEETGKRAAVNYNGTPIDVASVVSYLASKEAHFITGERVKVFL